jgi:hypothetical protein
LEIDGSNIRCVLLLFFLLVLWYPELSKYLVYGSIETKRTAGEMLVPTGHVLTFSSLALWRDAGRKFGRGYDGR